MKGSAGEGRSTVLRVLQLGPCVHRGKHHGVFQGPSFLCQSLRASAMTPSALQLFLLTFSVCFSHFLPHTPSRWIVIASNLQPRVVCVCVCCLKGVSHIPHQCWLQCSVPRFITNTRSVPYQICLQSNEFLDENTAALVMLIKWVFF